METDPGVQMSNEGVIAALRRRPSSYWRRVAGWTAVTAIAIALPARLVPNDFFQRMTPTRPLDYVFWIISSVLVGLVVAFGRSSRSDASSVVGGTATLFAVGCPVCNKLVVALIGTAGALDFFVPIQPVLGTAAIGLLLWSLRRQARRSTGTCVIPAMDSAR